MADKILHLKELSKDTTVQNQIVEVLESALKRAKDGEFADVLVTATLKNANTYYTHWSMSMDTARRVGLLQMCLFDMQHSWG